MQPENVTLTTLQAEAMQDDRAVRRALGRMAVRVIERLETELLSGKSHVSTTASIAREIRSTSEYLEGLLDRANKVTAATGPAEVEKLLTRLNDLTGQLQKLRAPKEAIVVSEKRLARGRKGMRTRDPGGVLVEGAAVEKSSQAPAQAHTSENGAEGMVPEGGTDGTSATNGS